MTNKELLEKIAEAINDSTETIRVMVPDDSWSDTMSPQKMRIINPDWLSGFIKHIADSL